MDNIDYLLLRIPILIPIFIGVVNHFHTLYISNTRLIIKQSDQIQFLVKRLIELNKKIDRLQNEIISLNETSSAKNEEDVDLEDVDLECEDLEDEDLEDLEDEDLEDLEDKDLQEKTNSKELVKEEEVFELIEKRLSPVSATNKKSSWLSFIF
jgi:hypothetical protein